MKCRFIFAVITVLLLSKTGIRAQQDSSESSADVAFWVAYWGRPRVALSGPPEKAFNKNVQKSGHSGELDRAGGGMGAVLSGLSRKRRRMQG